MMRIPPSAMRFGVVLKPTYGVSPISSRSGHIPERMLAELGKEDVNATTVLHASNPDAQGGAVWYVLTGDEKTAYEEVLPNQQEATARLKAMLTYNQQVLGEDSRILLVDMKKAIDSGTTKTFTLEPAFMKKVKRLDALPFRYTFHLASD